MFPTQHANKLARLEQPLRFIIKGRHHFVCFAIRIDRRQSMDSDAGSLAANLLVI